MLIINLAAVVCYCRLENEKLPDAVTRQSGELLTVAGKHTQFSTYYTIFRGSLGVTNATMHVRYADMNQSAHLILIMSAWRSGCLQSLCPLLTYTYAQQLACDTRVTAGRAGARGHA